MASEGDDCLASLDEVYETFDDMNLKKELLDGIFGYGFEKPFEVQQKGIVPLCKGRDVLVQAESGPARTATFCTAILQRCDCYLDKLQCIVLASDELVQEIVRIMREFGAHLDGLKVYACGECLSIMDDLRCFEHNNAVTKVFHVVVGSPPSVLDMFKGGTLRPDHIKMVVLDDHENDVTFEMDHIIEISHIIPSRVQVGVFSGTISPAAAEAFHLFRKSDEYKSPLPVKIVVKQSVPKLKGMTHYAVKFPDYSDKLKFLLEFLNTLPTHTQCVIYVIDLYWADRLLRVILTSLKLRIWAIHSKNDQIYRDMVMKEFRAGSIDVLITTDHSTRGIDIEVPLIINYDMTSSPSLYCKRIARLGRNGGVVINLVDYDDCWYLNLIHDGCGVAFEDFTTNDDIWRQLPSGP